MKLCFLKCVLLFFICWLMIWQAEKLHTKTLPFPYTSKEVFEQSIRMPIGPEFNPAVVLGALNRPEVSVSEPLCSIEYLIHSCRFDYHFTSLCERRRKTWIIIWFGVILFSFLTLIASYSGGEEGWCYYKTNQIQRCESPWRSGRTWAGREKTEYQEE